MPSSDPTPRRKILGIGYPKYAVAEWKQLQKDYDIHYFVPTEDRKEVISELKRLCDEHGPFDAGYVLFKTAAYSPFHSDLLGPLFQVPGRCGLWAIAGAGYDDVDTAWLTGNGCYLSNTPHSVTNSTADMAVLLLLNVVRRTYENEAELRAGRWRDNLAVSDDPSGKTLGVVGLGAIGKSMVQKLQPWGMRVLYHNRSRLSDEEETRLKATWVTKDELVSQSDIISLNCPLSSSTRHLLSTEEFSKMKDGVYIVNTSRGQVIDQEALIAALKSGKVAGAGLDVFDPEPHRHSWLFSCNKVSLQPHVGAYTNGTFLAGERAVFENVKAFLETGKPINPCNEPKGR